MTFKWVSIFRWGVVSCVLLVFLVCVFFSFARCFVLGGSFIGSVFIFDYVGFYLSLVSLFVLFSLYDWWGGLSFRCRLMLLFSIMMSFLCYTSLNVLVFWVSYELCILPLLFLLVVESSYSERFIAFWYLMGYVVLTSLPLLLCIFYLYGGLFGGFSFCFIGCCGSYCSWVVLFILCVCFITKIPLPPFHVWLPAVHAEASSPVSICLSGFIMKLGVLGVFRFAYLVLPYSIFSFFYVCIIFSFSVVFLLLSSQELDGKRWLAILSLSHIILSSVGLLVSSFSTVSVPFVFCLGHGVSAGAVFAFLWLTYNLVGSRNWNVLKFGLGGGLLFRGLVVMSFCSVASFPPTLSFFSEVRMIVESSFLSFLIMLFFFCYLFLSGLVPLFLLGCCLSRHASVSSVSFFPLGGVIGLLFILSLCFILFLVV